MNKVDGIIIKTSKKIKKLKAGVYVVVIKDGKVKEKLHPIKEDFDNLNNKKVLFVQSTLLEDNPGKSKYDIKVIQSIQLNKGIEEAIEEGEVFVLLELIFKKLYNGELND